ncbi:MAG TPA: tRNA uridine-5-carboxymethylaminomethyl(34) synthesis GTPase MnmE [Alphaproteobacteria bacterium]
MTTWQATDTIIALASAPGRAAVAVVRVSGPGAGAALRSLTGRELPAARRATRRRLRDPATGDALDDALVLWFPAPASYTGEDVVEFQIHGGRAVLGGVIEALTALPGVRPAEPGEFTRRAFLNGRLDLTAAEAIDDLVAADTAAQRRQALRQGEGALAALYDGWRTRLIRALAHLEADIDFPEEGLPRTIQESVSQELGALAAEMAAHLDDSRRGERLRDGIEVAIVGAPNVGKSTLLNALARREAAIVSPVAGTTRDVIEVHLDLQGYPVTLADTAGLREAAPEGDGIEAEGIRRALARARNADLKLAVFDAAREPDAATLALVDDATIVVVNKADLAPPPTTLAGHKTWGVSAREGLGVEGLLDKLTQDVVGRWQVGDAPVLTRSRHRHAVAEALTALRRSRAAALPELAAEDVRLAARALGRITGRIDVEDLLDVIFREFCIGK